MQNWVAHITYSDYVRSVLKYEFGGSEINYRSSVVIKVPSIEKDISERNIFQFIAVNKQLMSKNLDKEYFHQYERFSLIKIKIIGWDRYLCFILLYHIIEVKHQKFKSI